EHSFRSSASPAQRLSQGRTSQGRHRSEPEPGQQAARGSEKDSPRKTQSATSPPSQNTDWRMPLQQDFGGAAPAPVSDVGSPHVETLERACAKTHGLKVP